MWPFGMGAILRLCWESMFQKYCVVQGLSHRLELAK